MARKRTTVRQLASEAQLELDEALITLWDAGFEYINGPGDELQRGEANRARRCLGLATRRELASLGYWAGILGILSDDLIPLLSTLGVPRPLQGGRLVKKAISRLRAEARSRGRAASIEELQQAPTIVDPEHVPFQWQHVGHKRNIRFLTIEEVEAIHLALVQDFVNDPDPIAPAGVRSQDLLASAVHRPSTALDGTTKYPTVEMAAASLLHAIVHNHPFHNGNKRTALVAMLVFLDENGIVLTCEEDQLFKLVLQLAQHALVRGPRGEVPDREVLAVAEWLKDNSRWVEKGDRPIQWRRLQRILGDYGCSFEIPSGGNRINISRTVTERTFLFGRIRSRILRTQTFYGDQGREIDKSAVNKIRHDLRLNDEHGVDSSAFYDRLPISPSDFIVRYRKTLKRLARL